MDMKSHRRLDDCVFGALVATALVLASGLDAVVSGGAILGRDAAPAGVALAQAKAATATSSVVATWSRESGRRPS
jgi:hypothetical protein